MPLPPSSPGVGRSTAVKRTRGVARPQPPARRTGRLWIVLGYPCRGVVARVGTLVVTLLHRSSRRIDLLGNLSRQSQRSTCASAVSRIRHTPCATHRPTGHRVHRPQLSLALRNTVSAADAFAERSNSFKPVRRRDIPPLGAPASHRTHALAAAPVRFTSSTCAGAGRLVHATRSDHSTHDAGSRDRGRVRTCRSPVPAPPIGVWARIRRTGGQYPRATGVTPVSTATTRRSDLRIFLRARLAEPG